MPTHSQPRCTAARTAPRMTALSPGASPPPVEMAIFTSARGGFLDEADDFARCRVTAECLLGEHALAVHLDLEDAAGGLDELDLRVRYPRPRLAVRRAHRPARDGGGRQVPAPPPAPGRAHQRRAPDLRLRARGMAVRTARRHDGPRGALGRESGAARRHADPAARGDQRLVLPRAGAGALAGVGGRAAHVTGGTDRATTW